MRREHESRRVLGADRDARGPGGMAVGVRSDGAVLRCACGLGARTGRERDPDPAPWAAREEVVVSSNLRPLVGGYKVCGAG